MSFSINIQTNMPQYVKVIKKLLEVLKKHGYSDATIVSTIQTEKDGKISKHKGLTIKKLDDLLKKHKLLKGDIKMNHQEKKIWVRQNSYNADMELELNFRPPEKFKSDLENAFGK